MEKSPAYNYNYNNNNNNNGGMGMDTGITGGTSSSSANPMQQPAYTDNTKPHTNDYYAAPPASSSAGVGAGATPTTHPVGMDHTNRDSMASTAVPPATTSMSSSSFTGSDVILLIMAIFLPPVAVFLKRGCDAHFFINILLTILAWLPGMIHAFYVVVRYPGDLGDRRARKGEGKRSI
ncbi:plasma membrane proteolipid Pmp3 [Podospora bellae-mahoneyi]|uniref:Plasma membrane proteolipid Pmp3 n=1 Tax=Podospora bellae-mahoneyi TaxID=2093777 RepID=A0ABR0FC84_9PEZI|nr:plasma membrane proteolipid Pmp3 [Podospora bellae-mahoneyi]